MPPATLSTVTGLATSTSEEVPEPWYDWLVGPPLQSLVAVLLGLVVLAIARRGIARVVRSVAEGTTQMRRHTHRLLSRTGVDLAAESPLAAARRAQRAGTIGSVLRSSAALVVGLAVLAALSSINGWDLGPLLASIGIVGVALGFGAQTLVKDFLSGIFMLVEDQYGVGDVVDLGEATGTVEAVGLRVTQVRDLQGTLWFVRNGEVVRVGNKTQGWARAVVEVRIGPDQDVAEALALLRAATSTLVGDETVAPVLLGEPEVTGFEDFTGESVLLRATVKTAPAKQWEVQRALRAAVRDAFLAHGVPLAVPRREVLVEREARAAGGPPPAAQGQSSRA
ncbi:MAG TPA: mechanosensitive ion channel family protein [Actinotalea sp.]|nr:mechanosensitive ion channel family protein [Actinotalea sp.]